MPRPSAREGGSTAVVRVADDMAEAEPPCQVAPPLVRWDYPVLRPSFGLPVALVCRVGPSAYRPGVAGSHVKVAV